jgi:hypothetical protein
VVRICAWPAGCRTAEIGASVQQIVDERAPQVARTEGRHAWLNCSAARAENLRR